jgi:hypothetical protein
MSYSFNHEDDVSSKYCRMADCAELCGTYIAHAHLIDRVVTLTVLLEDGDGLHQFAIGRPGPKCSLGMSWHHFNSLIQLLGKIIL